MAPVAIAKKVTAQDHSRNDRDATSLEHAAHQGLLPCTWVQQTSQSGSPQFAHVTTEGDFGCVVHVRNVVLGGEGIGRVSQTGCRKTSRCPGPGARARGRSLAFRSGTAREFVCLMAGMRYRKTLRWVALSGTLAIFLSIQGATGAPADPAERGLDLFAHLPTSAGPGTSLPVQVQAYGFRTISTPLPLAGATVEAVWDPESLGKGVSKAPPPVSATTDASGKAHLQVEMPNGPARELRLLLGLRHGGHERTRSVAVARTKARDISLHVAEHWVVPGSTISAWMLMRSTTTQRPVNNAAVELQLLEGGIVRSTVRVRTDSTGTAIGRIRIPFTDLPAWSWTLRARDASEDEEEMAESDVVLHPREETPGTPQLDATWDDESVQAGDVAHYSVRVRDASGKSVGGHSVRYWIGPRGTSPPSEEKAWLKASTRVTTDAGGWIRGKFAAPRTVVPGGTTLTLVVRTEVEGQALDEQDVITVGAPRPDIAILPEAGSIVGGVEQYLLLHVRDERDRPVGAAFEITADGLRTTVTTNSEGEAVITWKPPRDIGGFRASGPCPGGVAAAVMVRPMQPIEALGNRVNPVELCVPVDRESPGVLRLDPPIVREGGEVRVRLIGGAKKPWSIVMRAYEDEMSASAWMTDGEVGESLRVPTGANGFWGVSVVAPGERDRSRSASSGVLVIPRVLPTLRATVGGGRAAPGGHVFVDATLSDGAGNGIQGSVAAIVYDRFGGGSIEGLWALDTRRRLCALAGVEVERCDRFLEGDVASTSPWALIGNRRVDILHPALDPAADVQGTIDRAFRSVVHSLEGAVLEASESPERMQDVRRRAAGGWTFNPELWTLVTSAMNEPPLTPGGEPLMMSDLIDVDRQVSFDNVAARVTRLKLFRVLMAVRGYIESDAIEPDEPVLRDPQALLRRMVHDGLIAQELLLDPWGGTLQFVRAPREGLPFLTVRGFALHAPGPDGRVNTADDIRDPFQRVLRSNTPYAEAVQEDRLVDARLDMRVSEATISAWERLLQELTGLSLGSIGTIGHGAGTGTGQGFGSGHGRLGGTHRSRPPRIRYGMPTGDVVWVSPVRTDANGKVRIRIPLGAVETTWRVGLVGIPDGAESAVAMVDVPSALPISARVEAGVSWIEGDDGWARISVRNRTSKPVRATLGIRASGSISLANASDGTKVVAIPPQGASDARVRVRAGGPGTGTLTIQVKVPGVPDDVVEHNWQVRHAGEQTTATQVAWVESEADVELALASRGDRALGPVRVVVERGHEPLVAAALESLRPDWLRTPDALTEAVDAAVHVRRWAIGRGGDGDALAKRASEVARHGAGRLVTILDSTRERALWSHLGARVDLEGLDLPRSLESDRMACPPKGKPTPEAALHWMAYEPAPVGGVVEACWDAFVTDTTAVISETEDPVALAGWVLMLWDRHHRKATAAALLDRLAEQVDLQPDGRIELPGRSASDRESRAIVYAALLRAAVDDTALKAPAPKLFAWLAVQRDPYGGYGSARATRAALQALLAYGGLPKSSSRVFLTVGDRERPFEIGKSGVASLTLPEGVSSVRVRVQGPPVLVKLQRRKVRLWARRASSDGAPVALDVKWPTDAKTTVSSKVQVSVRNSLGRDTMVDIRIPLPAGASLAAPVADVRQVQGVLSIRRRLGKSALPEVLELPIRFDLAGRFTVPEAEARLAVEEADRATAPARPLVVR